MPKVVSLPVFPAGFLKVGRDRFPQGSVLTILDVESGLTFKKAIGPDGAIVQAPARELLAGVVRDNTILELWKPIAPRSQQLLELPENTALPKGKGHLVVSLLFPPSGTAGGNKAVAVRWQSETGSIPPAVAVTGDPWRWTGFWFDLAAGEGALQVESKEWTLAEPPPTNVPDRGIAFARELKVISRPKLKARFEENERLPSGEAEVDLLDCRRLAGQTGPPHYSLCTQLTTVKGSVQGDFLFAGLDPVLYALRWHVGAFRDFHMVDFREGLSKDVMIPVAIYLMKGAVTRNNRPVHDASITWRHLVTGIESSVSTDSNGRYETLIGPPGQYGVFVDGPDFRRHAEVVTVTGDGEADFGVPANRTEALVLDAESSKPIPQALVQWGLEGTGRDRMNRVEQVDCDANGRALLPPFPPGKVTVTAKARGYRRSAERLLDITDDSDSAALEFRLVKGVETRVRLVDMNGSPAKGAWAQLPSGASAEPANDAGETLFEELVRPGDPVFVASAAGAIVLAQFPGDETPIRIRAPSRTFTVRILSPDGRGAHQQWISYAIDGLQVPQPMDYLARRAAGGDVYSRADGSLIVAGLPASGTVTLWPSRKRDAAVTRPLPVTEALELRAP